MDFALACLREVRMKPLQWPAALIGVMLAVSAAAGELVEYPDLPPWPVVHQAVRGYPAVLAAQAGMQAGTAARERLDAGSHEFQLNAGTARRRIMDAEGQRDWNDWNVGLEKALRLPGKTRLDEALGTQGEELSRNVHGEAMHEAARGLLSGWFAWLRERAQSGQWRQQVDILARQLEVVERRVQAGDAARLEADMAKAALMQAEISARQARLRLENAAAGLTRHFPGLKLDAPPDTPEPQVLSGDVNDWLKRALAHNHELLIARAESRIAQLGAQRADAERAPDPTLGVHYISERGGMDRIGGVTLSIPLPGAARRAASAESAARAEMAAQREAMLLRRLETDIALAYNNAQAAHDNWQNARDISVLVGRNEEKMARAYTLGEMGLNDLLLARRQSQEARLTVALARLEARETRYRLLLDTHQLWPLSAIGDTDPHHEESHQ